MQSRVPHRAFERLEPCVRKRACTVLRGRRVSNGPPLPDHLYDLRGGAETEFRADKSGGGQLHKRRKHKRDAQEVWIHLTDLAHNYFSWLAGHILADSRFAGYGRLRISRDLMRVPGLVEIRDGQLLSVKLLKSTPYASDLLACLERFWK